jgi:hypothetical protein
MLVIILFLLAGIGLGLSIGKLSSLLKLNEGILTLTIYFALFMFAITAGLDDRIVKSIDDMGWAAFIMIIAVATSCVLLCWIFYKTLIARITHGKQMTLKSEQ